MRIALALAAGLVLGGVGCSDGPGAGSRPVVAVSVAPQAWLVERLAADHVRIEVMIPPGANPVTWEPTLAQRRALSDASLYFAVGHPRFPFESTWLVRLLAEESDLTLVSGPPAAGDRDPHVWLSPRYMRASAAVLAEALTTLLPEERDSIADALAELRTDVDALDAEIHRLLDPRRGARFYVMHPAFGHFAAGYGLVQVALEPYNREPDPHTLARLIEEARAAGVTVVFAQPQFDRRSAEVVAAEIGARVELLDPLARDWSDNLRRVARALAAGAVG